MGRVIFPLLRPVTGTVAILAGVFTWNEFFLSVIFLSGTPNQPLSVAIYSFVGEFSARWNLIFAVVIISIAPILAFYLVAQRHLIKGIRRRDSRLTRSRRDGGSGRGVVR